ncbi:DEAD/DEAH box helicase [Metallosphaera hakonensis]|uniref:DNA methylase n=1 Tax=Metallosphaera hakonensis JCM 8857 = DSM 7519 TaxID=1293036 RepID=A0A2U9IV30_9CREN|nr:DEAD/DEAH box helicase [Metallosphaera hakonensis]AWR99951.1 DEAD/DEAH box helicase [Metallosphaera hakonensis JCM 8857 = DSM 7519]
MPSRTFYVKPFNNDILKRLMAFSRFLGETGEGAQFVIDLERARTNGVRMEEIRRVLGELGVSLDTETLEQLEHEMPEYDVLFELKDENLVLNPRVRISDILRKYRINIPYDSVSKVYRTRPFYYYILKKILEDEGLRVKKLDLQFERFSMGLNVELRSYQVEAIKAWKNNGFRGVIALPTGAGKTLIGIEGMSEVGSSTLVVTFTNEQLKQWAENIIKYTNGTPEVGLYYSKKKELAPITITTYQTAIRHMAELSRFNLLIIDEAHHLPAEKFREIALSCIAPYRMALSATPYRSDGKHVELFRLMGGLVYQRGIEELVAQGYLAKFKIVRIKTPLTTEERAQYDMLMKKFRSLSNGRPILEVVKKAREGDGRALEAMRVYSKLRYLVGLTKAKLSKIIEIIEKEKGKKVIIFSQYVDHAETISKILGARLLTGQMSKRERELVLEEFKSGKSGVLVLTTVGDEGLDIPDASIGIIVTGTSSKRQYVQRLGRLLRNNSGGKVAILYELIAQGTSEEYQSKKRRSLSLEDAFYSWEER